MVLLMYLAIYFKMTPSSGLSDGWKKFSFHWSHFILQQQQKSLVLLRKEKLLNYELKEQQENMNICN